MKIYDAKTIVPGVVIFVILLSSPVWYNAIRRSTSQEPNLTISTTAKQCIESTQWMRDHHMELLNSWRDQVVRDGLQTYTASDGTQYQMSLTTCLTCHGDKSNFCDQCHNYLGDIPDCWSCHNVPEEDSADK